MIKRRISINKKSKDWKDKYPMVEIHWVDIVSDSNWQSLDQLSKNRPPRQRATFFYSGSLVRGHGISANEQPTFVVGPNDLTWDAAKVILWP
jgi:hypothetical protein